MCVCVCERERESVCVCVGVGEKVPFSVFLWRNNCKRET